MLDNFYKICAMRITDEVRQRVCGRVHTEYDDLNDSVTVKVEKGGIKFQYRIDEIYKSIHEGVRISRIVEEFCYNYHKYINSFYFK